MGQRKSPLAGDKSLADRLAAARPTRRGVLQGTTLAACAVGLAHKSEASKRAIATPIPELFLIDRITFGLDESLYVEVLTRGYMGFLDWQLDPDSIDDSVADAKLLELEFLEPEWATSLSLGFNPANISYVKGKTPTEIATLYGNEERGDTAGILSAADVVFSGAWSQRQLLQVIGDFWMSVFNIDAFQKLLHIYWLPFLDGVIRPNALGTFGDLLLAVAKSPAMMIYLDQYTSNKDTPIENFARELMELFTLGEGNFTEQEVADASKILTGWSIHSSATILANYPNPVHYDCRDDGTAGTLGPDELGAFVYLKDDHDFSVKTIQGKSYGGPELDPNDPCEGRSEAEELIADLALHPQTADTLVRRMIQWFLYDTPPPQTLVDRVTGVYLSTGGNIQQTLRELFRNDTAAGLSEIYVAPATKVRRPLNKLIWQMRVQQPDLPPPGTYPAGWVDDLVLMGQAPTTWPTPDGHPGDNAAWTGTVLPRLNTAARLAFDQGTGLDTSASRISTIFGIIPTTQYASHLNVALFLGALPTAEVQAAQTYVDQLVLASPSFTDEEIKREALAIVLSLPSAQYLH